jgi:hypothetical protein
VDQPQLLHPNLARLAAVYDDIIERLGRRELNNTQARAEMLTLIARDDNGTQWRISPTDGTWQYQTRFGDWVAGTPASYGYATPTAFDVSRGSTAVNPDKRISFQAIDESLLHAPDALAGATRRIVLNPPDPWHRRMLATTSQRTVALVAVVAIALAGWWTVRDDEQHTDTPSPAPSVSSPAGSPTAKPGKAKG